MNFHPENYVTHVFQNASSVEVKAKYGYSDITLKFFPQNAPQFDDSPLRAAIAAELKTLEPWYKGGTVHNPMDAVQALKNIERLVI